MDSVHGSSKFFFRAIEGDFEVSTFLDTEFVILDSVVTEIDRDIEGVSSFEIRAF